MQRRSTTRTTPRKRYTTDAFDGIEGLQDARSDDESQGEPVSDAEAADSFAGELEEVPEDDELMDGDEYEDISDEATNANDEPIDDSISDVDDSFRSIKLRGNRNANDASPRKSDLSVPMFSKGQTFTRGLADGLTHLRSMRKGDRWLFYFGPSNDDIDPVFKARSHWANDVTLPSRNETASGVGGFHASFFLNDADRARHVEMQSEWISSKDGQQLIDSKQVCKTIDLKEAEEYVSNQAPHGTIQLVMGPVKTQKMYSVQPRQMINLADIWRASSKEEHIPADFKNGFVLNTGGRVQSVDWAPNQTGVEQYIAVSIVSDRTDWSSDGDASNSTAFTPQPPSKSHVEIWELRSTPDGHMDTQFSPRLALVLCNQWGHARHLKWCSAPYEIQDPPSGKRIGLLAGIWCDGAIRVLDVVDLAPSKSSTSFVEVSEAAFRARPPNTVCTSLTWIDGRKIAAGCANGCVAVWDIPTCLKSSSRNARPLIYTSVAISYILAIESCGPSKPGLLATLSVAGDIAITDISKAVQSTSSYASTVHGQRNRVAQPALLWHEFSQVVLQLEDSNQLRGSSPRRLFAGTTLGRYDSIGCCLAGSAVHPFILIGTQSGEVVTSNPTMRVIDGKTPILQQNWFTHEWRRQTAEEQAANEIAGSEARDNQTGLTRTLEGQKVYRVGLLHDADKVADHPDRIVPATIYEEKSAITALAWNPNIHVGGWAAAGCADGLLRLEDLAI